MENTEKITASGIARMASGLEGTLSRPPQGMDPDTVISTVTAHTDMAARMLGSATITAIISVTGHIGLAVDSFSVFR